MRTEVVFFSVLQLFWFPVAFFFENFGFVSNIFEPFNQFELRSWERRSSQRKCFVPFKNRLHGVFFKCSISRVFSCWLMTKHCQELGFAFEDILKQRHRLVSFLIVSNNWNTFEMWRCLVPTKCLAYEILLNWLTTSTVQLCSQWLLSHALCSRLEDFPVTIVLRYFCTSNSNKSPLFRKRDGLFAQNWNCCFPNIFCEFTQSTPMLSGGIFQLVWNYNPDWSGSNLLQFFFASNECIFCKHQKNSGQTGN